MIADIAANQWSIMEVFNIEKQHQDMPYSSGDWKPSVLERPSEKHRSSYLRIDHSACALRFKHMEQSMPYRVRNQGVNNILDNKPNAKYRYAQEKECTTMS